MLLMLLHMIPDSEQPHELVSRLMAAMPPGSYLVISHPASDIRAQSMADMAELLSRLGPPMAPRSHAEVSRFFDGLDLVEPGVVALPELAAGFRRGASRVRHRLVRRGPQAVSRNRAS